MQPVKRRGKARPKILYWFRTPPGVRVGRAAIDEDAIRQLEANNPDVEFDWQQILKGQGGSEGEAVRRTRDRGPARPSPRPESFPTVATKAEPAEPVDQGDAEDEDEDEEENIEAPQIEPATPVEARLGSQGLARLRARYAELLTRIADRVENAERQEELKGLAERLNPDAWITDADVTAGLDAYEPTYEMVRSALPPRRKPGEPV